MALRGRIFGGPQAGLPPCPSFTDVFDRDDTVGWGTEWIIEPMFTAIASAFNLQAVYTSFFTKSTGTGGPGALLKGGIGLINPNLNVTLMPWPLINQCLNGKAQFSEINIASDNTVLPDISRYGPGVFLLPTQSLPFGVTTGPIGYSTFFTKDLGTWVLQKITVPAGGGILLILNTIAGPVLRLEVIPRDTDNVLNMYENGVLKGTVTDIAPDRPVLGFPGFWVFRCAPAASGLFAQFAQFSGGLL